MTRSVQRWFRQQVSWETLAADIPRMVLALVLALLTRYVVRFLLTNLTTLIPDEALGQPVAIFATYFFFCV